MYGALVPTLVMKDEHKFEVIHLRVTGVPFLIDMSLWRRNDKNKGCRAMAPHLPLSSLHSQPLLAWIGLEKAAWCSLWPSAQSCATGLRTIIFTFPEEVELQNE